jgi:CubicO group peptidase (beta-lactamase class C family)
MTILKALLIAFAASVLWLGVVFFGGFYGLWMQPLAPAGDSDTFFREASAALARENPGHGAMVLIENGEPIAEFFSDNGLTIDADTVFATASMSKFIAAIAVLQLVEEERVVLDAPVNTYLTNWQLPPGAVENDEVTVRRLLSHTAGLEDGLGFGDYAVDEPLPTLLESLENPRAAGGRSVELVVTSEPGTWNYSGGGYLILELLVEEVSGQAFADYVQGAIFDPLGMTRSSYDFLGDLANNAGSIDVEGNPAPVYKYASNAATAFTSSTDDLTRLALALISNSTSNRILLENSLRLLREPHGRTLGVDIWGLGSILYAPIGEGGNLFGHDGGNEPAINSTLRINPINGDGIIVLVTGHPNLATRIGSEWVLWQSGVPDVLNTEAVIVSMFQPAWIGLLLIFLALLRWSILRGPSRHNRQ